MHETQVAVVVGYEFTRAQSAFKVPFPSFDR